VGIITDFFKWIQSMLQGEPVLTLAVVQAGIAMAVGFGLNWSGEQVALTVSFFAALLGWIARTQVSPTPK
jgi:hypothetical protein